MIFPLSQFSLYLLSISKPSAQTVAHSHIVVVLLKSNSIKTPKPQTPHFKTVQSTKNQTFLVCFRYFSYPCCLKPFLFEIKERNQLALVGCVRREGMMGLVDYETDNEDGNGDSRVGGNMFKSQKGGISNALFLENELTWTRSPGEVNASQMTGGVVKRKVMSMELAKERESTYRTKMEHLKKQRRDESYESPKTVQVVSSSTRTTETKRAPATNISRSPPQGISNARTVGIKSPSPHSPPQGVSNARTVGIKRPLPSNLSRSTPQAKQSYSREGLQIQPPKTVEFKRALPTYQSCMSPQVRQSYGQETPQIQPSRPFGIMGASPANLPCSPPKSRQSYSQEALQTQHARSVEILRASPTHLSCSPSQLEKSYSQQASQIQPLVQFCKECNVICSGVLNLTQHRQGKKHKARLEQLKMHNGVSMENAPIICNVCNIPCMGEYNYREHLAGRKHTTCLQAIEAAKRLRG